MFTYYYETKDGRIVGSRSCYKVNRMSEVDGKHGRATPVPRMNSALYQILSSIPKAELKLVLDQIELFGKSVGIELHNEEYV